MVLLNLSVKNYRNIESCCIGFEKGVNLLYGENAQGKTNALECIYSFARGKSFRGTADKDLIRFGSEGFLSEITFKNKEREQSLSYRFDGKERIRLRNGIPLERLSEMIGHFRAVLFYPEHLQLVKGGPAERRKFLSIAISQIYPVYIRLSSEYNRILENRNCLLKFMQKGMYADKNELDSWSEALISTAARIHLYRKRFIEQLSEFTGPLLGDISENKEKLSLSYESDVIGDSEEDLSSSYRALLEENRGKEIAAGCTLFGVHRDDLEILINGISARSFASQGQQRSIVLALKLAEGEVSKKLTGEYPVFLFDDVLSELDERRRSYILSDPGDRQFILTACECSGFDPLSVRMIRVNGGGFENGR